MNTAFITVPIDPLDFHDFLLRHGCHLVKGLDSNEMRNTKIGFPQVGDAIRHYSGITARIRETGKDRHGKYIKVTNFVLPNDVFQSVFYDWKLLNNQ